MSIRAIAIELYRAQQKVARLEKELELAAPGEEAPLKDELRVARLELRQMRTMLDGAKVESPFTTRTFGR